MCPNPSNHTPTQPQTTNYHIIASNNRENKYPRDKQFAKLEEMAENIMM